MKLGYPCINRSLTTFRARTFRLKSFSEALFFEVVDNNLSHVEEILKFNNQRGFSFFRISSDLVPFASHTICRLNWQRRFAADFARIGRRIQENGVRISMHPNQFTLINSPDVDIFNRSVAELAYHAQVLDLLGLDETAKIQIHTGGAYGDKPSAIRRFIERFKGLSSDIRKRLVVENDDRLFSLKDVLEIWQETGVPVLFDTFHHEWKNNGETMSQAAVKASQTWGGKHGIMMVDYSSQERNGRAGQHAESLDPIHFLWVMKQLAGLEFDLMLEIKDKEKSAALAKPIVNQLFKRTARPSRKKMTSNDDSRPNAFLTASL